MPDRLLERAELMKQLALGKSIQMLAPRRIGKTWLIGKLQTDLEAKGWTAIYIDLQGMGTTGEFLEVLCSKLQSKEGTAALIQHNFKQRLDQLMTGWAGTPLEAVAKLDAKKYSDALIASLNEGEKNAIILLDEIALFVLNLIRGDEGKAKDFLYHLRSLRHAYPKVRWLYAGSIGLDAVARRHELQGAQLGMHPYTLEPFTADDTREFINRLCTNKAVSHPFDFDDAAFEHFVAELGWLSPFYIDLLANVMHPTQEALKSGGLPVAGKEDVDRSFQVLLSPQYRAQFSAWEEHITKNYHPPERSQLRTILDICCATREGNTTETLQGHLSGAGPPIPMRTVKDLLLSLANDGFLRQRDERWQFRSGLLRRYWVEYMV